MHSFQISIDQKRRLIHVLATGEFDRESGGEMISAARAKAVEQTFNILYDIRDAVTNVDYSTWFQLPRELDVLGGPNATMTRVALLISHEHDDSHGYIFYEFVAKNAGLQVRSFSDERQAVEWLQEDAS